MSKHMGIDLHMANHTLESRAADLEPLNRALSASEAQCRAIFARHAKRVT